MKNTFLVLVISSLVFMGCEKDEPDDTSSTSISNNTTSSTNNTNTTTSTSTSSSTTSTDSDTIKEEEVVEMFTCKINGVQKDFDPKYIEYYPMFSDENIYDDNFIGNSSGRLIRIRRFDALFDYLTIELFKDLDEIKPPQTFTTLSEFETEAFSKDKELEMRFTDLSEFEENLMGSYTNISLNKKAKASVTITSTDNDVIEGTFEGSLYHEDDVQSEYKFTEVTDGKFKIKLIRENILNMNW